MNRDSNAIINFVNKSIESWFYHFDNVVKPFYFPKECLSWKEFKLKFVSDIGNSSLSEYLRNKDSYAKNNFIRNVDDTYSRIYNKFPDLEKLLKDKNFYISKSKNCHIFSLIRYLNHYSNPNEIIKFKYGNDNKLFAEIIVAKNYYSEQIYSLTFPVVNKSFDEIYSEVQMAFDQSNFSGSLLSKIRDENEKLLEKFPVWMDDKYLENDVKLDDNFDYKSLFDESIRYNELKQRNEIYLKNIVMIENQDKLIHKKQLILEQLNDEIESKITKLKQLEININRMENELDSNFQLYKFYENYKLDLESISFDNSIYENSKHRQDLLDAKYMHDYYVHFDRNVKINQTLISQLNDKYKEFKLMKENYEKEYIDHKNELQKHFDSQLQLMNEKIDNEMKIIEDKSKIINEQMDKYNEYIKSYEELVKTNQLLNKQVSELQKDLEIKTNDLNRLSIALDVLTKQLKK